MALNIKIFIQPYYYFLRMIEHLENNLFEEFFFRLQLLRLCKSMFKVEP